MQEFIEPKDRTKVSEIVITSRYYVTWRCPICGVLYGSHDDGYDNIEEAREYAHRVSLDDWICTDCEESLKKGGLK